MIKLHKLNGTEIVLNSDLIQSIEAVPDTRIILTTGNHIVVKEPVDEVLRKIIEYNGSVRAVSELKKEEMAKKELKK